MAIATLTGAAELACGHALLSKVYALVEKESIEAGCPEWVTTGRNDRAAKLLLWSESGSGRKRTGAPVVAVNLRRCPRLRLLLYPQQQTSERQ